MLEEPMACCPPPPPPMGLHLAVCALLIPLPCPPQTDPVILATGHTYDRASIERWMAQGHKTCPVTGMRLRHLELTPNFALRSAIVDWAAANGVHLADRLPAQRPEQPAYKWSDDRGAGNILHVRAAAAAAGAAGRAARCRWLVCLASLLWLPQLPLLILMLLLLRVCHRATLRSSGRSRWRAATVCAPHRPTRRCECGTSKPSGAYRCGSGAVCGGG